jgi:hypothetical protein
MLCTNLWHPRCKPEESSGKDPFSYALASQQLFFDRATF